MRQYSYKKGTMVAVLWRYFHSCNIKYTWGLPKSLCLWWNIL